MHSSTTWFVWSLRWMTPPSSQKTAQAHYSSSDMAALLPFRWGSCKMKKICRTTIHGNVQSCTKLGNQSVDRSIEIYSYRGHLPFRYFWKPYNGQEFNLLAKSRNAWVICIPFTLCWKGEEGKKKKKRRRLPFVTLTRSPEKPMLVNARITHRILFLIGRIQITFHFYFHQEVTCQFQY